MENAPVRYAVGLCAFVLLGAATWSCAGDATGPAQKPVGQKVVALVEIRFTDIGTAHMSASAVVQPIRSAGWTGVPGAQFDLTLPLTSNGAGDATIQLDSLLASSFTHEGQLYVHSAYRVRNASHKNGSAFDTPRNNLTFMAVETAHTIPGTAVSTFLRADGSPADPLLAQQLVPTGTAFLDNGGDVVSLHPDVLQVITEDEAANIQAPAAVMNIFPYGFVVRRTGDNTSRVLNASPAASTHDGIVNFALRIPLHPDPTQNPSTLSIMVLALDDSETRLTQSVEEQSSAGRRAARERAGSLRAAPTLLAGGTLPWYGGYRTICTVRTAGPAAAPLAYMINVPSSFASLAPDPYAANGAGSFIDTASQLAATFSQVVNGAGPATFRVRGLQSGQAHRDAAYLGNGTSTVVTPAASFIAGEDVEFVTTSALSCPRPYAGRLRVASTAGTGQFETALVVTLPNPPTLAAAGDLNNDNIVDLVVTSTRSNSISILIGAGNGMFDVHRTYSAGANPRAVALADLNDDGALDVAVTNQNAVGVLIGNGDGTLRPRSPIDVSGNGVDIALADVNADGLIDVLMATDQGRLAVALGNGDGTFVDAAVLDVGKKSTALAVADFNSDGSLDVVVADITDDVVNILLGNGDGTFQNLQSFPACQNPIAVIEADMNRDGNPDLVLANDSDDAFCILTGDGNGGFAPPTRAAPDAPNPPFSIAAGDIDANGSLDLVATLVNGELVALISNGNGTFMPPRLIVAPGGSYTVFSDVDNNGSLDLIMINLSAAVVGPNDPAAGLLSVLRARQ